VIYYETHEIILVTTLTAFVTAGGLLAIIKQPDSYMEVIYFTISYAIISLRFFLVFFGAFCLLKSVSLLKLIPLSGFLSIIYTSISNFFPYLLMIIFLKTEIYFFYYLSCALSLLVSFYFVFILPLIVNIRFFKVFALLLTVVAFVITITVSYLIITNTSRLESYLVVDPILSEYMEKDVLNGAKSEYLFNNQVIIDDLLSKILDEKNFTNPFFQNELISQLESVLTLKPYLEEFSASLKFKNNKRLVNLNLKLLELYEDLLFELKKLNLSEAGRMLTEIEKNKMDLNHLEEVILSLKEFLQNKEDNSKNPNSQVFVTRPLPLRRQTPSHPRHLQPFLSSHT